MAGGLPDLFVRCTQLGVLCLTGTPLTLGFGRILRLGKLK